MPGPRKRLDPKVVDPTPFAFKNVTDPITGETVTKRIVSPQITDEIMSTGNATVLEKFYNDNAATLTAADKKYLKAKLSTARKIEKIRKKQLTELSKGNEPFATRLNERTEVIDHPIRPVTKPISCKLPDIKMSQGQTSNNGCWSYALSLMLKSKGIDLSQEEIRAYRPNIKPDSIVKKVSDSKLLKSELDTINNVYENSDLVMEVLPNHFMKQYVFSPFVKNQKYTTDELEILKSMKDNSPKDMKAYKDAEKKLHEDVRKHYLKVTKEKIEKIIFDTIMNEKTPIAVNLGNSHYITITGYDKTTGVLNIVDSQQKDGKTSVKKNIDELITQYIAPVEGQGVGLGFTTLNKIPVPSYENRLMNGNEYIGSHSETKFGRIEGIDESPLFNASNGLVAGKGRNNVELYNYRNVYSNLNNDAKVVKLEKNRGIHPEEENDAQVMCMVDTYFPKKVIYKKDTIIDTDRKIKVLFDNERNHIYDQLENPQNNAVNHANNAPNHEEEAGGAAPILEGMQAVPNIGGEVAPAIAIQEPVAASHPGSFGEFIKTCKDQINRQKDVNFKAVSSLYAVYKYIEKKNIDPRNLGITQMNAEDKTALTRDVKKYNPLISTYMGEKNIKNTKDLNYIAVNGSPSELIHCINDYCNRVVPISSPGMPDREKQQKSVAIGNALAAMKDTGTGINYFGSRRSSNSTQYNNLIRAIETYQQKEDKDPFETFNLKKKCLAYISDKYTVRSSPSGKIRFEQTMKILRNIMCPREFSTLVNDINKARGLAGKAGDENYLTVTQFDTHQASYVGATSSTASSIDVIGLFGEGKISGNDIVGTLSMLNDVEKGENEIKDIMAVLIAAHEITGGDLKKTVIDPNQAGKKFAQFKNRVNQIKSGTNPAFEKLLKDNFDMKVDNATYRFFDSQKANDFINDKGISLAAGYNEAKKQMNASKKKL